MNNKYIVVTSLLLMSTVLTSCTYTKQEKVKPAGLTNSSSVNVGQSVSIPQKNGINTLTGSSIRK